MCRIKSNHAADRVECCIYPPQKTVANERKDYQRFMPNVARVFICLFISSLSLKAQSLSPLTIAEAHAKEAELTALIESVQKSAPQLAPKDTFESTADFTTRKQNWMKDQEKKLEPLQRQLQKLKDDLYTDPAVKPEFESYNADSEFMRVRVPDRFARVWVPKGKAKKMHDFWAGVGFASNDKKSALVFQREVFPIRSYTNRCKDETAISVKSVDEKSRRFSLPSLISKVEPESTEKARKANLSGTVKLSLVVGADGNACNVVVVVGLGLGLDEEAVEAVSQWKFAPGMRDGKAVSIKGAAAWVTFRNSGN